MPSQPSRPAPPGRASRTALGTSLLLSTVLAANQAAARPAPSLPYLVQAAPLALRLATLRPVLPSPPRIVLVPADKIDTTPDYDPIALGVGSIPLPPTPAVMEPPVVPPPAPAKPEDGVPLMLDNYAPPSPVRVEDILPFLLPAPRPVSRATYEIK